MEVFIGFMKKVNSLIMNNLNSCHLCLDENVRGTNWRFLSVLFKLFLCFFVNEYFTEDPNKERQLIMRK